MDKIRGKSSNTREADVESNAPPAQYYHRPPPPIYGTHEEIDRLARIRKELPSLPAAAARGASYGMPPEWFEPAIVVTSSESTLL